MILGLRGCFCSAQRETKPSYVIFKAMIYIEGLRKVRRVFSFPFQISHQSLEASLCLFTSGGNWKEKEGWLFVAVRPLSNIIVVDSSSAGFVALSAPGALDHSFVRSLAFSSRFPARKKREDEGEEKKGGYKSKMHGRGRRKRKTFSKSKRDPEKRRRERLPRLIGSNVKWVCKPKLPSYLTGWLAGCVLESQLDCPAAPSGLTDSLPGWWSLFVLDLWTKAIVRHSKLLTWFLSLPSSHFLAQQIFQTSQWLQKLPAYFFYISERIEKYY